MPSQTEQPRMSLAEVVAFLDREFPQMRAGGSFRLEAVAMHGARLCLDHDERHLRPGGTVSGPTMMALADYALYAAILASIGPIGLAVSTNLAFNFLRRPGPRGLVAEASVLKLGRRLAVGEVRILQADDIVCHATGTYSIPPGRTAA
jgi:uncharacterized protein (TIGR00369 family)